MWCVVWCECVVDMVCGVGAVWCGSDVSVVCGVGVVWCGCGMV